MSASKIDWTEINRRMAAAEAAMGQGSATRDRTREILKARAESLA